MLGLPIYLKLEAFLAPGESSETCSYKLDPQGTINKLTKYVKIIYRFDLYRAYTRYYPLRNSILRASFYSKVLTPQAIPPLVVRSYRYPWLAKLRGYTVLQIQMCRDTSAAIGTRGLRFSELHLPFAQQSNAWSTKSGIY